MFSPRGFPLDRPLLLSLTFAFSLCRSAFCQDAVPADIAPSTDPGLTQHEVETLQGNPAPPEHVVTGEQLSATPRRLSYSLSLTVRGVYDDNINISSFNKTSDYYISIEPSFSIGFGGDPSEGANGISLIYRPSVFLFVDHSENDTVQHLIRLQGNHNFGRLTLALSQDVQILEGADLNSISDPTGHNANIDVGQRTRHNIFTTQVSDTYDLTGKLFLSNVMGLTVDDYPSSLISSKNFFGNLFINYNYSDKVTIGLGGTGGYNTVEPSSPDQTYEQANLRLSYAATGKLAFNGSVGAEFRQFENETRGTFVSPVFELTGSYKPFDGTTVALTGNRRIQNSASLGGEDYTSTDIHLLISQRFLRRFTLALAIGYNHSDYFSTFQGIGASRVDDYYYVQPAVDAMITRWWSAGGYYLYRKDSSSLAFFSFDDNQFGLRSTISF